MPAYRMDNGICTIDDSVRNEDITAPKAFVHDEYRVHHPDPCVPCTDYPERCETCPHRA